PLLHAYLLLPLPAHLVSFFFYRYGDHRDLPSFPTRRSSDLSTGSRRPTSNQPTLSRPRRVVVRYPVQQLKNQRRSPAIRGAPTRLHYVHLQLPDLGLLQETARRQSVGVVGEVVRPTTRRRHLWLGCSGHPSVLQS